MNEKMKKTMKRSLALMLALILVIGAGTWMRDGSLKADEEAPEARVVVEEAAPAEAPAPAPVEEPVVVVQQVELTPEPPAAAEPAAEEKQEAEAEQQVEEPVPAEEPAASEEEQNAEAPEDDADASFDVEEAYEYYMSLGSDEEKASYLDSLDAADRKALEDYIAEKELEAAGAAVMFAAAPAEEEQEAEAEAEAEADKAEAEAPEDTSFGSAKVSGEWAGRDTSTLRSFSIEVYVDGELADFCSGEANKSVANFSVALGDCTVASASSSCGAFSGSNGSYTVDMYADTSATVTIMLETPEAEEEPVEEGSEEFDPAKVYEAALAMTEEEREAYAATLTAEEYEAVLAYAKSLEAEKEKFDSEAAYKEVMALPEEEREAYVMALSEEDYKALEEYALNLMEKKSKAVHYDIAVSVNYEGELGYGTVVTLTGDVLGFDDDESLDFVWEESADGGKTWTLIPGATGLSYSFTVTPENATNTWRISIA